MTRAIQIAATGGPEQLQLADVPVGEPGAGEIRIRHHACGLNYIDVYHRTGLYPLKLPHGIGMEGAGVVEAVGEGVTHLKAGDRAAYASNPPGSYCEARVMPAKTVCKLPDGIAFDTAAAMMLKGLTVQYLLKKTQPQGGLAAGDFVLWHAAAGGVGLIACQWAKAMGLKLIATAGSAEKCQLALDHGAAFAIDYRKENFVERVKAITDGQGREGGLRLGRQRHLRRLARLPAAVWSDGQLRQRQRAGAAVRARPARPQGLAVPDARHAVHAHRHARSHAGDGRRSCSRWCRAAR